MANKRGVSPNDCDVEMPDNSEDRDAGDLIFRKLCNQRRESHKKTVKGETLFRD